MDTPSAEVVVLTVIQPELRAARAALQFDDSTYHKFPDGTIYYCHQAYSTRRQRAYSVALGCIGTAGNTSSAAATMAAISHFRPRALLLMGIAAGIRGKIRIGDVVLSDRVVNYEPGTQVLGPGGQNTTQPAPAIPDLSHAMLQDVTHYYPDPERLNERFRALGQHFPSAPAGKKQEFRDHVVAGVTVRISTIASGEKLLRDPSKLIAIREQQHARIEVGEMEAAGFAQVCARERVDWLVVRGVSDFGDQHKSDAFHMLAAHTAAVVLADFIAHGLDLDTGALPCPIKSMPAARARCVSLCS